MAIYISWKNKLENSFDVDVTLIFKHIIRTRMKTDFSFFILTNNVDEFKTMWCLKQVLCSVKTNELVFGHILSSGRFNLFHFISLLRFGYVVLFICEHF